MPGVQGGLGESHRDGLISRPKAPGTIGKLLNSLLLDSHAGARTGGPRGWGKEVCCGWERPTSFLSSSASWLPNIIQFIVIIWDRRLPPADPEFIWLISTQGEPGSAALKSTVLGRNRLASSLHISEKPITCLLLLSRNETHIPRGQSPSPAHSLLSQPCGPFCQPLLSEMYSWALNHLPMGLEGRQEHKCPSGAKRFTQELEKPPSTTQMGQSAGGKGHLRPCEAVVMKGHQGKRWLWRRSGILSYPVVHIQLPPALIVF